MLLKRDDEYKCLCFSKWLLSLSNFVQTGLCSQITSERFGTEQSYSDVPIPLHAIHHPNTVITVLRHVFELEYTSGGMCSFL